MVIGEHPVPAGPVVLSIDAVDPASPPVPLGHGGPDDIVLGLIDAEGRHELARLDGRYLSSEVASGFTGRMLALGATDVPAHIRRFATSPAVSTTTHPLRRRSTYDHVDLGPADGAVSSAQRQPASLWPSVWPWCPGRRRQPRPQNA